ncbi:ATP-dependent DNA helicase RecG [Candidatus Nanosynbacter sp. TM7-057]|uniref:ATP-dependent DNA helicase RecG n=1 Tax=Candidatus Nanosynbacter sp. TM7-057 TaxID=2902630 RepID=UPI001FB6E062|nr:ATP-dependent DNA helicase RecG [Candidatus Nanosynbacter sp. TM7-057]MCJ1965075.1 ATP-dependent DNA helicase RecG [Candidatus Nanosynbacter sp. TM7-057]
MKLATPLEQIKGVGPKTAQALAAAGLTTVSDALNFLPRAYDDYSTAVNIADLQPGKVTVKARCESVSTRIVRRGLRITTAVLADKSGKVKAVWFNQPYRETQLKSDAEFIFSGQFGMQYNRYQINNPSVELAKEVAKTTIENASGIQPIYKSIKNIRPKTVQDLMKNIRPIMDFLPETLPENIIQRQKLVSRSEAVKFLHAPKTHEEISRGRERLAFEELFEMILAAQFNKQEQTRLTGWKIPFNKSVVKSFVSQLPFPLTNAQRRAAWQILQDLESDHPMNRLLQGDVGSGKTVVAGLVAAEVAKAGFQTAIMAPTEILAQQHAKTLDELLSPFGVSVALLTGHVKGAARSQLLDNLASGNIDVVVGTHALIQEKVAYHKLGFAVIDEQHRFGVKQRQALLEKSDFMPHLLSMTATPIPRSLALTLYGELDISILDELPSGRQPIQTKIWSPASAPKLYESIENELAKGRQAYVICPLIDDNPDNDKKSVEAEYNKLSKTIFSHRRVGLLHGKLPAEEKAEVMQKFADGELDMLVSTTVVEVGVNVPNATVMLIENADNFGLSQLHQLRGRVGRGKHQSFCHLMMSGHDKPSQRLREIEKSQDGFYLAEVDLKLRGPGEIYGKMQHGDLNLKIASLADTALIARAQVEAERFVKEGQDLLQYNHLAHAVSRYQRLTVLN